MLKAVTVQQHTLNQIEYCNHQPIFGLNAFGLRSKDSLIARDRSLSNSIVLWQSRQSQSLQNSPFAKHSQ